MNIFTPEYVALAILLLAAAYHLTKKRKTNGNSQESPTSKEKDKRLP